MIGTRREGIWRIKEYSNTRIRRLMECPICGYEFELGESRADHILDEHEWEDLEETEVAVDE